MADVNPLTLSADPSIEPLNSAPSLRESGLVRTVRSVPSGWWKPILVIADAILILAGFGAAYFARYQMQWFRAVDPVYQVDIAAYTPFALALVVILLLAYRFSGVYPYRRGRGLVEQTYTIATATTAGVVVLIAVSLVYSPLLYSRLIFLYTAFFITLLMAFSRLVIQVSFARLRRYDIGVNRMLLVGAGDVGRMVMRNVAVRPDFGYRLIGFLDDNPVKGQNDIGPFKALGSLDNFEQVVQERSVDTVVICLPWQSHRMIQRLLRACEQLAVRAQVVPDLFQLTKNQMEVQDLNGIPLLSTRDVSIRGWNLVIKRASDLAVATVLVLIGLPFALLIALAIRLDSKGPLLYTHTRIGRNGQPFCCHKFRSMVVGADTMRCQLQERNEATGPLFKLRDDPRCTRVGRFLRRYSLDEVPQLINVLRGEMSLVGPRPNLPHEVEQYQDWHHRRLAVSPGMTGLWQVSGRSDLTFDEMVLLDIYYVENWNMAMDVGILLRTVPTVLRARGAY